MNTPSRAARLAVVVAIAAATITAAGSAGAANGIPRGVTAQEWKALLIRGEALNRQYHLGTYANSNALALRLRGEALNARYGNAWTRLTADQFRTVVGLFGPSVTQFSPQALRAYFARGNAGKSMGHTVATTSTTSGGFAWGDAGIGALATVGVMLVSAAGATARRRSRAGALATTTTS